MYQDQDLCIRCRIDTLGPLGDYYIHQACKHVTRSRGYVMSWERVNVFVGNEIEQRYGDAEDQISDKLGIEYKGNRTRRLRLNDESTSWRAQGSALLSRAPC